MYKYLKSCHLCSFVGLESGLLTLRVRGGAEVNGLQARRNQASTGELVLAPIEHHTLEEWPDKPAPKSSRAGSNVYYAWRE